MTSTIDLAPILCLSVPERIEVVQTILHSIANDTAKSELSDELKAELDRRLAKYEANPIGGVSWDEVETAALARRTGMSRTEAAKPELSEELKAELHRRLADSRANPNGDIPWEQVKAEILSRSRR